MKLIACYGSLKKGKYNHGALGEGAEFKGDHSIVGVMYSNGSYPKLYHVGDIEQLASDKLHDHALEIYNVSDEAYKSINHMELGAGYEAEEIETPYGWATIWYMPHAHFSKSDKWVESY